MNFNKSFNTDISTGRRVPSDIVSEYEYKRASLSEALETYNAMVRDLTTISTIGGTYPGMSLPTGHMSLSCLEESLLKSAWRYVWKIYELETLAGADRKRKILHMFEKPIPFTLENIRDTFGDMIADPWYSIHKALAEAFVTLDPSFRSHEKMKIGVKGLPKRVILSNVGCYGSWGRDRITNILNAIAAYEGKPLVTYEEINTLFNSEDVLNGRGVWLKRYQNGNGHLYFSPETLLSVNKALADFYGQVLPDCYTEGEKPTGTAVSKDLQFYPTPKEVISYLIGDINFKGKLVLEPSCGTGNIMEAVLKAGGDVFGIEFNTSRAMECRGKGLPVAIGNFLETPVEEKYDYVMMNPPFYGKHYAKHVKHAYKFLKQGGLLRAVLPVTAQTDHGLLDDMNPSWFHLPIGSFRESGTNVNTVICTIRKV